MKPEQITKLGWDLRKMEYFGYNAEKKFDDAKIGLRISGFPSSIIVTEFISYRGYSLHDDYHGISVQKLAVLIGNEELSRKIIGEILYMQELGASRTLASKVTFNKTKKPKRKLSSERLGFYKNIVKSADNNIIPFHPSKVLIPCLNSDKPYDQYKAEVKLLHNAFFKTFGK